MDHQRRVYPSDHKSAVFDNAAFDGQSPGMEGHVSPSSQHATESNSHSSQIHPQTHSATEHTYKPKLCTGRFFISVAFAVAVVLTIIVGLTTGIILQLLRPADTAASPTSPNSDNRTEATTMSSHVSTQAEATTDASTCAAQGKWGCADGTCIHHSWRCDGDHDCTGGDDENNCPTTCSSHQFECSGGTCIPASWQCDSETDCPSGDDEVNCTVRTCTGNEFTCDNGACVPKSQTCDSYRDCSEGEDELNCEDSTAVPSVLQGNCSDNQLFCYDSNQTCIAAAQWCDGTNHCPTGRDEKFCICGKRPVVETSRRKATGGSPRIVGGTEPARGAWPWQVSIHDGGEHTCGASLVNPRFLVTAAHCVYDSPVPSRWAAYLGLHEQGENTDQLQTRDVDRIIIHERYDAIRTDFDIALMELSADVNITDHVYPVCLPGVDTDFPAGTNCWISGWGAMVEGSVQATTIQHAEVPLINTSVCDDVNHYDGQITDRMLCAGYDAGGIDACQGDSGGPLVCQDSATWYLVGVTSWGDGCGQPNKPGIYANVKYLRDWINTKLES